MQQKITIIGGSGFVGTNLCQALNDSQQDFEILDIKPSKKFPDKYKMCDVRDINHLYENITGSVVVNLAAVHRDDVSDPVAYTKTNVEGATNVVQACREKGINKIIFTSSVAVYGFTNAPTDEKGQINPFNEYGRSKFEAEKIYKVWQRHTNGKLIIIRPTAIFGEGNRGNVFNLFNQIASNRFIMAGQGTNVKSIAYIHNFVEFLKLCIQSELSYGVVNYVDTPDLTINELVEHTYKKLFGSSKSALKIPMSLALFAGYAGDLWAKMSGRRSIITSIRLKKFTASSHFISSNSHFKGFSPPFSLIEGIDRTLEAEFINPDEEQNVFHT